MICYFDKKIILIVLGIFISLESPLTSMQGHKRDDPRNSSQRGKHYKIRSRDQNEISDAGTTYHSQPRGRGRGRGSNRGEVISRDFVNPYNWVPSLNFKYDGEVAIDPNNLYNSDNISQWHINQAYSLASLYYNYQSSTNQYDPGL